MRGGGTLRRSPAASESFVSLPSAGSTATISVAGESAWIATAQPAISPPPETGA